MIIVIFIITITSTITLTVAVIITINITGMVFLVITFSSIDQINKNLFCLCLFREEFTVNVLKFITQFDFCGRGKEKRMTEAI